VTGKMKSEIILINGGLNTNSGCPTQKEGFGKNAEAISYSLYKL